jgi:hypothetical protein
MKKILAAVVISGIAVACSGAEGYGEDVYSEDQGGVCGELKYELEATLAAQVGKELGRWESDRDFVINYANWSIMLTQEGLSRCASRGYGDCPGVKALLALQFHGQNQVAPNFQPGDFRNTLLTHYQRYRAHVQNNMLPITQAVDLNYESSTPGACGPMHWYRVDGLSDTSKLHYKLIAYGATPQNGGGNHENPYIRFQSSESKVGIDPTYEWMDGEDPDNSGSCTVLAPPAASKIDCSGSINGQCCEANGRMGTFTRAPWNFCTFLCN